ncbi:MAG: succinate dehydrogenase assembly factor 2 [Pseudomonadota bacterium]|nr:succinate dehydrogenase assembly factor 2 [Pseudomonadota bacterium]
MKELDVLLTRYLEERYRAAAPDEQQAFHRLLDAQDPLLYAYFMGRAAPPDAMLSALLKRITAGAVSHR